ncbi:uncharacterized protein LOC124459981 isoform X2 [Drosophila willistoni]|uniref:uncharacterized protein LOC124459981 isoform X2 n=1 Tax=Drosophila willistoni TaxID=7260 RepID=UPI001F0730AD|nr:uncharacterized protein LOC124459981 isoform X2 [Drosophila willistoni]
MVSHLKNKHYDTFVKCMQKKITTLIGEKYKTLVIAVKKVLSKVEDVAFTFEVVTITNSSRPFLTITAHFINKECLESICLKAARMDQMKIQMTKVMAWKTTTIGQFRT